MPADISSLQNRRVKAVIQLRDPKHRARQGRFVIDGLRELQQAAASTLVIREAYHCPAWGTGEPMAALLAKLGPQGTEIFTVTPQVWDKLTFGHRRDGLLAVADTPARDLTDLDSSPLTLVVVLQGLEKPGNTGAVVRTANGAGADAVLVADGSSDLYNPNAIRSSLGMLFRTPTLACTSSAAIAYLRQRGLSLYVARLDAQLNYAEVDLAAPCALVLGSETHGVSAAWKAAGLTAVRLPMLGQADSLNVSAAAAVLLYEAVRQRQR